MIQRGQFPGPVDGPEIDLLRAVEAAADLARAIRPNAPPAHAKPDRTPLTAGDLAVQAVVAHALERIFPGEPLVAEEDASALRGEGGSRLEDEAMLFARSVLPALTRQELVRLLTMGTGSCTDRCWTLDPIDGTEGFLRDGHYAVSLTRLDDYAPAIAIVACPTLRHGPQSDNHGIVLFARRGAGTWISPMHSGRFQPARVSAVGELSDARVVRSLVESHIDAVRTGKVLEAAGIREPPALMDSQAKHVVIAAGWADLFVRIPIDGYRDYIWDHAAGSLAIEEAGGRVTDMEGRPLDFRTGRRLENNCGIVASNGRLHVPILQVLRHA